MRVYLLTRDLPDDNDVPYVMKMLKNLLARFRNRHDLNIVYVGGVWPNCATMRRADCGWMRETLDTLENRK